MLGDLDGDGKSDLVVWRPGNGTFYWLSSSSEYSPGAARMIQWGSGALGDVPMLGDLDGDTRADLVVWRGPTGFFYWLPSSAGYTYAAGQARQWGTSTLDDVPMIGDLDGDHRGDLAVWRPGSGTFYWLSSRRQFDESASRRWGSGSLGDVPMLRDTDADGRADLIVWRPTGTFYWLTSALDYGDASAGTVNWGAGSVGDVPPG